MTDAFACFDRSGDGQIDVDEFHDMMANLDGKLTVKEIDAMLIDCDTDQDGTIS